MKSIPPDDSCRGSEEAAYWQAVTRLLDIGQMTFQSMQEASNCLCEEIKASTGGLAQLVLFPQSTMREKKGALPAFSIPVHTYERMYGKLIVAVSDSDPSRPALPREVADVLAAICGSLLSRFELTLYVQEQRERFDLTACQPLTGRETEILFLMKQSLRDLSIAQALSLAVETVHAYQRKIYAKLNVHNRQDALLVGRLLGLLPQPTSTPSLPAGKNQLLQ